MIMSKYNRPTVKTGDRIQYTGYYIYDGSPTHGEIPCYPSKGEKVIVLEEGKLAPPVHSCNDHPAIWKLIIKKQAMEPLHIHSH